MTEPAVPDSQKEEVRHRLTARHGSPHFFHGSNKPFRSTGKCRWTALLLLWSMAFSGCMIPRGQYETLRSKNQAITDKYEALKTSYKMLQEHSRKVEDRLCEAESERTRLQSRVGFDRQQLADTRETNELLEDQLGLLVRGDSSQLVSHLASSNLPLREAELQEDGSVTKLENDILFRPGSDQMRPEAEPILSRLVRKLKSPEGQDLRVLLVGHTDDQKIVAPDSRTRYGNNFRLSTARANVVGEYLRRHGIGEDRIGLAGFGGHQPIAANTTEHERRRNRRVEIFLCHRRVPVLGWTETIPQLY